MQRGRMPPPLLLLRSPQLRLLPLHTQRRELLCQPQRCEHPHPPQIGSSH